MSTFDGPDAFDVLIAGGGLAGMAAASPSAGRTAGTPFRGLYAAGDMARRAAFPMPP
ncbi:hypothetical protein [Actinomadura decatromicini]|uniref:hypothetical protein n=1 Tax=Actinomadura decatromicini TaxID=2604572 RepID=UPI001652F2E1|nr:hypothetical protein [Actinomadura decatromicini]